MFKIKKPTKHMKELCKRLGPDYRIVPIDFEQCIYRDFHNGYDIEVSGANTNSLKKTVTIYMWKNQTRVVFHVSDIPQDKIEYWIDRLYQMTKRMNAAEKYEYDDWDGVEIEESKIDLQNEL